MVSVKEWQFFYMAKAREVFGPRVKCCGCKKFDAEIAEGLVRLVEVMQENGRQPIPICHGCAIDVGNAYSARYGLDLMEPGLNGWPAREPPGDRRRKISVATRTRIFERDEYRCKACGTHKQLSLDHIIAIANGGSDDDENLQTLCRPCNSSKGKREGWRGRRAA